MEINLKNVEEIIFFDKKIQELFPEFRHFFDQWRLGKTIPALGGLGSTSVIDLLNSLNSNHVETLEKYFGVRIVLNKLDPNFVKNHSFSIDGDLCGFMGFQDLCAYRNKDKVFLTLWR